MDLRHRGKDVDPGAGFPIVTDAASATPVTVYWRPGCPYCRRLRTDLRRTGLPVQEIDIWRDPAAATTVRSLAGGNETVPTVTVGEHAMVNPRVAQVLDAVRQVAPELVTNQASRSAAASRALRVAQWVIIAALVVASFTVDALGHATLSWVLDAVAVAVYLLFRLLRR